MLHDMRGAAMRVNKSAEREPAAESDANGEQRTQNVI